MPYIKQEDRAKFDELILKIVDQIECPGELNYAISQLLHTIANRTDGGYTDLSTIVNQAEMAKLEFYRRRLAPYEDLKIAENGDVVGL